MSDEEWDANGSVPISNKWEGEDEGEVKDAWDKSDSEPDEKKVLIKEESKPTKTQAKKNSADKTVTKEAPLTSEEILAEKLRVQKLEDSSNLQLARDICGLKENKIDSLVPETKEDFDHFGKAISEKIQTFASSEHYSDLIENITKDICVDLKPASLKKLKLHMDSLIITKQKLEKTGKSKQKVKGMGVKMDLEKDIYGGSIGDYDDMDDFM